MRKKLENVLFEKHCFLGPLLILLLSGLPWWIGYWPGTLQYDSCGQLLQYLGVGKMTGHHPLPVTMVMGGLLDMGRALFQSDNAGVFLYTGLQFCAQCFVLAYCFQVYRSMAAPMWIRWGSLLYYTIFPLVPNWGISYGKDSGYYISFILFTIMLIEIFWCGQDKISVDQKVLWILSLLGLVFFRNDGRYVVAISILLLLLFRRKYWKLCLSGTAIVLLFLVMVESIYMPLRNIPSGSVREALSVPLMQTANYLGTYGAEVTEEERAVLLSVFEVDDLQQVADEYDEVISDDVKALFKEYPDKGELLSYLKVWWKQFCKHPGSYVLTYWNHCDGYFNLAEKCYDDIIGWFKILDAQSRTDEYLDIRFGNADSGFRDKMEALAYALYDMPVIGWLYRPALHTYILLGSIIYLLCKRRRQELLLVIPGLVVLLICTVSPLNGSVRYFLPVMVTTPIYIAFCAIGKKQEKEIHEDFVAGNKKLL